MKLFHLVSLFFALSALVPLAVSRPLLENDEASTTRTTSLSLHAPPSLDQRNLRGSATSSDDEGDQPSVDNSMAGGGSARRHTLQARTTLLNVDIDELTPEQIIFFEDTWVQVFNKVFHGVESHNLHDDTGMTDVSSPRLRSFVVEDVVSEQKDDQTQEERTGDGRVLAGKRPGSRPRGIKSFKWFDIWALMETSCRLCGKDDDYRRLLTTDHRSMKKDKSILRDLETELCERLREGPFACFQALEECRVMYVEE